MAAPGPRYLLDFDGVICDSRRECMVTSRAAHAALEGQAVPAEFWRVPIEETLRNGFLRFRYLARTAREFCLIWDLLTAGRDIDGARPLAEQVPEDGDRLARYHGLFYATRRRWADADRESWIAIHDLYPGVGAALGRWFRAERARIVSSKDRVSIMTILGAKGVAPEADRVDGCDDGDKIDHFRRLGAEFSGPGTLFIDDNLENLETARSCGLTACLADWGYLPADGAATARARGIPVLSLDDFVALP